MNKNKKEKIDKSILEWLPFKEVWNDLLYLDNDKVVGIIKVNSINLQLYSNEEQTSKIFQFRKVLLSLEYPFKILALDKPISLSEHIENLLYLSKNNSGFACLNLYILCLTSPTINTFGLSKLFLDTKSIIAS